MFLSDAIGQPFQQPSRNISLRHLVHFIMPNSVCTILWWKLIKLHIGGAAVIFLFVPIFVIYPLIPGRTRTSDPSSSFTVNSMEPIMCYESLVHGWTEDPGKPRHTPVLWEVWILEKFFFAKGVSGVWDFYFQEKGGLWMYWFLNIQNKNNTINWMQEPYEFQDSSMHLGWQSWQPQGCV